MRIGPSLFNSASRLRVRIPAQRRATFGTGTAVYRGVNVAWRTHETIAIFSVSVFSTSRCQAGNGCQT
jgi:hypothetical protein